MGVSDAEYARRYEREVQRYVARHDPRWGAPGLGKLRLSAVQWAWVEDGSRAALRWSSYVARYPAGLKAINADGTWRPWDPRAVR